MTGAPQWRRARQRGRLCALALAAAAAGSSRALAFVPMPRSSSKHAAANEIGVWGIVAMGTLQPAWADEGILPEAAPSPVVTDQASEMSPEMAAKLQDAVEVVKQTEKTSGLDASSRLGTSAWGRIWES